MININANTHAFEAAKTQDSSRSKEIKAIQEVHKESKAKQFTQIMSEVQSFVQAKVQDNSFETDYENFKDFLSEIEYDGEPIASLSQEEAMELVSEDGFFGVGKTSERISEFVISAAGSDENLLREGRKGILQGLKQAEEMWGGKLPDIAYETIDKAIAAVDKALIDGGFSVLDAKA